MAHGKFLAFHWHAAGFRIAVGPLSLPHLALGRLNRRNAQPTLDGLQLGV